MGIGYFIRRCRYKGWKCFTAQDIPVGAVIHNIELKAGKGAQHRSAGNSAQLMAKEGDYADQITIGEVRMIRLECKATIGQVEIMIMNIRMARGQKRHMGWRPTVRGSMNPVDHPHGGGRQITYRKTRTCYSMG